MDDLPPTLRRSHPTRHAARRAALLNLTKGRPIVVFGMGSALGAGTRSHGGMRFLTGWDSHESSAVLLLGPQKSRLLLTSPFILPSAIGAVPELSPEYLPFPLWSQTIADFLAGQTPALIGVDEMPMGLYRTLALHLEHGVDVTSRLDDLRQVKDPAALDLHRFGASICDTLFAALPEAIKENRRGRESQRILEDLARQQGAEYCRTWLTLRPQADHPRYWPEETEKPAEMGDQMLFGVALTVDGHWAHGLRMGHIGPVPAGVVELHKQVATALNLGIDALRPGRSISEAVDTMADALGTPKGSPQCRTTRSFRAGHGLGLTYEEPGLTAAFAQTFGAHPENIPTQAGPILEAGMVLELHPNIFVDGIGGAALGQMIEITQTGAKPLLKAPIRMLSLR
ncbi:MULTISPECIES: M24 family metallopeptidase [Pacificibacter]|uniref:M24 family metallopeptidase n=1 Tax=Pacificibacter TaxID=1042323 RepID=UPI001C08C170|nr:MULTISPECIES: M24 family metallopeptidase [Pacificibacter]MBU2937543.1 M24 family metallopeptidase [Pacificibacter marinus]MDO6616674.1 M24 family metallopeptidase [Pacificibacter sp. 1_MG-2023]